MKIAWVLKNDPLRSNSALVRAVRASQLLQNFAERSVCVQPPPGMSKAKWLTHEVVKAADSVDGATVVVLQKIWNIEAVEKFRRQGVRIVFDADDEYEDSSPAHRQIVSSVDVVVCSSGLCRQEIAGLNPRTFEIPCYPEEPALYASAPSPTSRVVLWTGYSDSVVEIEPLRNVLTRLKADLDAHIILHASKGVDRSWWGIAESINFRLEEKDAVMRRGHVGISNKPLTELYMRKTEDKVITYMAYGLVPVCSPIPAYRKAVQDGVTGFLVDPDNEAGWYDRLATLLTSAETWTRMSRASLLAAQERYSSTVITAMWREALGAAFLARN